MSRSGLVERRSSLKVWRKSELAPHDSESYEKQNKHFSERRGWGSESTNEAYLYGGLIGRTRDYLCS